MSADLIANYIETFATCSQAYPILFFLFIFVFMTIESSFIPFPSEVVMIPAGFLVARYNMLTPWHIFDLGVIILIGLAGSLLGAFINYVLAIRLGRPFLHKYGKYFFLKEQALDRAEEIFRDYGEIVTFVCRLLPAIRQLISNPAGLSRMDIGRFRSSRGWARGFGRRFLRESAIISATFRATFHLRIWSDRARK